MGLIIRKPLKSKTSVFVEQVTITDALKGVFQYDKVKNYVLTKLKNGEQVALVGYTRQELMINPTSTRNNC